MGWQPTGTGSSCPQLPSPGVAPCYLPGPSASSCPRQLLLPAVIRCWGLSPSWVPAAPEMRSPQTSWPSPHSSPSLFALGACSHRPPACPPAPGMSPQRSWSQILGDAWGGGVTPPASPGRTDWSKGRQGHRARLVPGDPVQGQGTGRAVLGGNTGMPGLGKAMPGVSGLGRRATGRFQGGPRGQVGFGRATPGP